MNPGDFTGEVIVPTENAHWYAFNPSHSVSLVNQDGTKDGAAAKYGLAGKTAEVIPAGSKTLHITLHPETAILVIENKKGAGIDINVKELDWEDWLWVSGLGASSASDASFIVETSDTKVSLFSTKDTGAGPYYVVVPAGVQLEIYDGDTLIAIISV